jgi:hypothetical protein
MKHISKFSQFAVKYYYFPVIILFAAGGLGIINIWFEWAGMIVFALLLYLLFINRGNLKFPPNFKTFLAVLLLLLINVLFSHNQQETLKYLFMFVGGGALWIFAFNLSDKQNIREHSIKILLLLGLFFAQYTLIGILRHSELIRSFSLISYSSISRNHHNIGDFFSLIALLSVYKLFNSKNNKISWYLLNFISFVFIFYSRSRSALLSLGIPMLIMFRQNGIYKKYKKISIAVMVLLVVVTLFFAQRKSLLFSREYFIQGLAGLIHNPLGVGVGNFEEISSNTSNQIMGATSFSSVAHNLPLEFLTGLGIFGLVFLYFYVRVAIDSIRNYKTDPVSCLMFLSLSVNFLTHFTYAIPVMLWLWFLLMGLIYPQNTLQDL